MSDHYHYEYAEARHDHRGEYAGDRHEHGYHELSGVAEEYHRHYDLERDLASVRRDLDHVIADLRDALDRIRQLEEQTPEARQAEYEADVALADDGGEGEHEPYTGPCCGLMVYDDSIGRWCPEHGDQP